MAVYVHAVIRVGQTTENRYYTADHAGITMHPSGRTVIRFRNGRDGATGRKLYTVSLRRAEEIVVWEEPDG